MSYAGDFNLITSQLADSSEQVDSRLKRMLATSLVVHAVLLFGLMSVRFTPTLQRPLASYHVDLVTLPAPRVTPSTQAPSAVKQAKVAPPAKPQAKPPVPAPTVEKSAPPAPPVQQSSPTVVEPVQVERVMPSIVESVESVTVPQSRQMPSVERSPAVTPSPAPAERKEVETPAIPLPSVPEAPQLSRKASPKTATPAPSVPSSTSLADTLKHAVQSVPVPQKPQTLRSQTPATQPPKRVANSPQPKSVRATSPRITTPGQAPQLAKVAPIPKSTEVQPTPPPKTRVADSLKQVVQSVVVPEVRKSKGLKPKKTQAVTVPISPTQETQPQKPKELKGIVIPSEAPKLAAVDVARARKSLPEKSAVVPPEAIQPTVLEQKIAKLVIPEVQVPEGHHILSTPTDSGMQKTTTTLQVSGSSPDGHAYWGRVWSKIDREWIAPQVEVRSGKPIRVLLGFRVERNGAVKNLVIEESSGNEYYDSAAKRAVFDAVPLPPFTSEMPELHYDIQFQFTVNVDS